MVQLDQMITRGVGEQRVPGGGGVRGDAGSNASDCLPAALSGLNLRLVPYLGFRLRLHPRLYSCRRFAALVKFAIRPGANGIPNTFERGLSEEPRIFALD